MFDISEFMKPLKPMKPALWHKPPAEYVTGDQIDRVYGNGYENGLLTGAQAERERIIKLIVEDGGLSRFVSRTVFDSNNENVEWEVRTLDLIALIKGEKE